MLLIAVIAAAPLVMAFDNAAEALVGDWEMITEYDGQQIPATMSLAVKEGKLVGVWKSQGGEMAMQDIVLKDGTLTFHRTMGDGGQKMSFSGKVEGAMVSGEWASEMGNLSCKGVKAGASEGS